MRERGTMGVSVEWANAEHTVVLWTVTGQWTWTDFDAGYEKMKHMAASVGHSIDSIYDLRHSILIPADVTTHVKFAFPYRPPNLRYLVAVGLDTYIQLLWNTLTSMPNLRQWRAHFVDTLEEAYALIDKANESG
jgi:hypothetical protein